MSSSPQFRSAGLTYDYRTGLLLTSSFVQYVEMCSRLLRSCMKEPHRSAAMKTAEQAIKVSKWANGKQGPLGMSMAWFYYDYLF